MDTDTLTAIKAEERAYNEWAKEEKNRILKMSNEQKKQAAWNHLFPPFAITGEIINSPIY